MIAQGVKKVLIVSFNFPPVSNSGAVRVGKLAKYLPEFGWEPVVLTPDKVKGVPQSLPIEINEANVIRTPYLDIGAAFREALVGDEITFRQSSSKKRGWKRTAYNLLKSASNVYELPVLRTLLPRPIGWYPYAVRAGYRMLKEHKFDAIFSSYYPSSSHFVASRLQRRARIPWVAEYRDLWALSPYSRKIWSSQLLEQKLEMRVMKNSALLVAVSEHDAHKLEEIHQKGVAVLPNGFDEDDYTEYVPLCPKFTVTYTGTTNPVTRNPATFFEAISQLKQEGRLSPDNFEVRFFGVSATDFLPSLIEKYGLGDLVKLRGFVPFEESVRRQKESAVLLLLEWDEPSAGATYTGKIYEYLGAQRPILALAYKGGNIDNLLRQSGTGVLLNDVRGVKDVLCHWLEEWHDSGEIISYWKPDANVIKSHTRRERARKLAKLLEETSA